MMEATKFKGLSNNRLILYKSPAEKMRGSCSCPNPIWIPNLTLKCNKRLHVGLGSSFSFVLTNRRFSTLYRKHSFPLVHNLPHSSYGMDSYNEAESYTSPKVYNLNKFKKGFFDFVANRIGESSVRTELAALTLPAFVGQAIEPMAQLMETAYIGRLGSVELASTAVSVTIFNIVSKLFNIPLLSITTSFVAEDISNARRGSISDNRNQVNKISEEPFMGDKNELQELPSVSTALVLAAGIGMGEALALFLGSGLFIRLMGISSASPMYIPSQSFLRLRAFGAPAVVVALAAQGVFRGFKDTKTPLLCLGVGNIAAVILLPLLIYSFRLGVTGAAIATVSSQYLITFLLIWFLTKKVVMFPPKMGSLQFGGYIKSGGFLLGRTLSVLLTTTLATSMVARQGPIAMSAHQICLQVWLAVSLLSDAVAASGQALIAGSFSRGDYKRVKEIAYFVLKTSLITGITLALLLCISFSSLASLFTKDAEVLGIVRSGLLFVSASQPINALAFVFDGLHYGVSDFSYSALSMMLIGAITSSFLLYVPPIFGLRGVWSCLVLFMTLRMAAGVFRLRSKVGPWWFLHSDLQTSEQVST